MYHHYSLYLNLSILSFVSHILVGISIAGYYQSTIQYFISPLFPLLHPFFLLWITSSFSLLCHVSSHIHIHSFILLPSLSHVFLQSLLILLLLMCPLILLLLYYVLFFIPFLCLLPILFHMYQNLCPLSSHSFIPCHNTFGFILCIIAVGFFNQSLHCCQSWLAILLSLYYCLHIQVQYVQAQIQGARSNQQWSICVMGQHSSKMRAQLGSILTKVHQLQWYQQAVISTIVSIVSLVLSSRYTSTWFHLLVQIGQ